MLHIPSTLSIHNNTQNTHELFLPKKYLTCFVTYRRQSAHRTNREGIPSFLMNHTSLFIILLLL